MWFSTMQQQTDTIGNSLFVQMFPILAFFIFASFVPAHKMKNQNYSPFFDCIKILVPLQRFKSVFLLQEWYRVPFPQKKVKICSFPEYGGLCRTYVQYFQNRKFENKVWWRISTTQHSTSTVIGWKDNQKGKFPCTQFVSRK